MPSMGAVCRYFSAAVSSWKSVGNMIYQRDSLAFSGVRYFIQPVYHFCHQQVVLFDKRGSFFNSVV